MAKFKFETVLGIISILGFLGIIVKAATSFDIATWIEGAMFFIIGLALMASGGYKLFFKYFEDGLTWNELNKVITIVIGGFSVAIGIFILPIFNLDFEIFNGIKIIIATIAIFVIALDMLISRS